MWEEQGGEHVVPECIAGSLVDTLDGRAVKVVTCAHVRATACHQTCAQARESGAVNRINMLSPCDCRASGRGMPEFSVTKRNSSMLKLQRIALPPCVPWPSALEVVVRKYSHSLTGDCPAKF